MLEEHQIIFNDLWGELVRGKADHKHAFRYVTLSTIGIDNWPNSRTLVLRDVHRENNSLFFFSDKRSQKVEEIKVNNKTCLLFYNNKKKIQLRIFGTSMLLMENEHSNYYFEQIKQSDLKDYRTKRAPSSELTDDKLEYYSKDNAIKHFTVIRFKLERIDYLKLDREGHQRIVFTSNLNGWSSKSLVP